MINKNLEDIAVKYYELVVKKNTSEIKELLHLNVELVGPMGTLYGKDKVFSSICGYSEIAQNIDIKSKFSHDSKVMLAYDLTCPMGLARGAVLMTFYNQLIIKIELYYDPRPFLEIRDEIFSKSNHISL